MSDERSDHLRALIADPTSTADEVAEARRQLGEQPPMTPAEVYADLETYLATKWKTKPNFDDPLVCQLSRDLLDVTLSSRPAFEQPNAFERLAPLSLMGDYPHLSAEARDAVGVFAQFGRSDDLRRRAQKFIDDHPEVSFARIS